MKVLIIISSHKVTKFLFHVLLPSSTILLDSKVAKFRLVTEIKSFEFVSNTVTRSWPGQPSKGDSFHNSEKKFIFLQSNQI